MVIKLGVVAALGTPAVAVPIFEILLNATSMFNDGNVALPARLDRMLMQPFRDDVRTYPLGHREPSA